jgi:hypothetical protein
MSLSLKESAAVAGMANLLYDFLPGSGNPAWKGHVTFQTVAAKVGVSRLWPGGTKQPAIVALLQQTLLYEKRLFEPLILEIVRHGIVYRHKNGKPVTAQEIELLNGYLCEVGFKFPDLWDRDFMDSLGVDSNLRARQHVERIITEQKLKATVQNQLSAGLSQLKETLEHLYSMPDRAAAGLKLETLLNRLFSLFELAPRQPFRVVGEQIDGSFGLDYEIYLVEAKWEKSPLPVADLYVLREKIEGKSPYTRGVLIALEGISEPAREAITRGKQPNFFVVNGHDLMMVLSEQIGLPDFLRQRQRLLAEEGLVAVPFGQLWAGSRVS